MDVGIEESGDGVRGRFDRMYREIRRRICQASSWLGVHLDDAANEGRGPRISRPGSAVSAWVIPTNEELMIARHTAALLGLTMGPAAARTQGV